MPSSYVVQSILAGILKNVGEERKKKAMEDTLDKARAKGYDIDIEIDPQTGRAGYKLKYKSKTKSELMKDEFDVMKMLYEANKWKKEAGQTQREEDYQNRVSDWTLSRPSSLQNMGIDRQAIKNALWRRNKYLRPEFQGTEFARDVTGKYREVPAKKAKLPTETELYKQDVRNYVSRIQGGDITKEEAITELAEKYPTANMLNLRMSFNLLKPKALETPKTLKTPKTSKYRLGQIIPKGGKKYKVTGFDKDGEPLVDELR